MQFAGNHVMTKKISIQKLADELDLAPSTVYRALSGHPNVSLRTRRKVLHASQKRGYLLPIHEKGNIAVIVPGFASLIYQGKLLHSLTEAIHRRGFRMLAVSREDIALLGDHMFDGIISMVWDEGFEQQLPQSFSVPTVILNGPANLREGIPNIRSDNPQGIRMALEYLRDRGCRRIFYISTFDTVHIPDAAERLAVFRQFCRETGQDHEHMHLEMGSEDFAKALPSVLDAGPDACFCASETFAAQFGTQIKAAGKRIPEDISLMGLEDDYANACFSPPITAIRQNFEQLAETAAERIASACRDGIPLRDGLIPFTLIERRSVRDPAGK